VPFFSPGTALAAIGPQQEELLDEPEDEPLEDE
jgi:hypothetical protein